MRFFWTSTWGVTLVTISWFQTFLYIKYISSIFEIDFIRWDDSSVSHSGLSISNTSTSGTLFFPRIIFCTIIGLAPGGICPCCLLYQFSKKIPFANMLKSSTCSIVNKVNFKLIWVEVLSWEKENLRFLRFSKKYLSWSMLSSKREALFFFMTEYIDVKSNTVYWFTLNKH
ncbi:MAG: hypothetical protein ACD_80C00119G0001 [uncultured bacterium (gcode 4)]|uniref:Uncharacterized protein n=1 Tax=uncultured bacterium (gcode 4) TaxID=1234023 RepID=K1X4N6_9BACT|nr:MAG: hypothetical protein ACD_80C00119G0001 [uncultured bacterium (gcode 4)]